MPDAEDCVILNRMILTTYIEDFKTSVELFELLERQGDPPGYSVQGAKFHKYRIIAAQQGALSIYHFGCSLNAIKRQLPASPFAGKADALKLREALRQFRAGFPNIDSVRHGIAHAAELYKSPAEMKRNRQRVTGFFFGPSESWFHPHRLVERTYSVGIEGTMFSVQLDQNSVAKLEQIKGLIEEAFRRPAAPTSPPAGN